MGRIFGRLPALFVLIIVVLSVWFQLALSSSLLLCTNVCSFQIYLRLGDSLLQSPTSLVPGSPSVEYYTFTTFFKWLLVTYTKDGYVRHDSFSVSVIFVSFAAGTFRDLPLSRKAFGPPSWSMPGLLTPYDHTIFPPPFSVLVV